MKKLLIGFIISFIFTTSIFAYNLTENDNKKAQLIASKIEALIKKKGEIFREKYIVSLTKLQTKTTNNPKLQAIIDVIIDSLNVNSQKINQIIDEILLKVTYPKNWGKIEVNSNVSKILTFTNLMDENGGLYYKNNNLSFSIINYNEALKWNNNFIGGGESSMYNLKYFGYMKNKFVSFDSSCTETIEGGDKCYNLKKEKIGNNDYLSYIEFGWSGDWHLQKNWIRFIDNNLILISLDLSNGIADSKTIDKIVYPDGNGVNFDINKVNYSDFKIYETKLTAANKNVENFLNLISLSSISQNKQIIKYTIPSTWKMYKNDTYKFSLKYPSELPIKFDNENKTLLIGELPFEPAAGSMNLNILDKNITEYEQYIKDNNEGDPCTEAKNIVLGSNNVQNIVCKSGFTGADADTYYLEHDGKVYEFNFIKFEDEVKNEIFKKVISTFEFLK